MSTDERSEVFRVHDGAFAYMDRKAPKVPTSARLSTSLINTAKRFTQGTRNTMGNLFSGIRASRAEARRIDALHGKDYEYWLREKYK